MKYQVDEKGILTKQEMKRINDEQPASATYGDVFEAIAQAQHEATLERMTGLSEESVINLLGIPIDWTVGNKIAGDVVSYYLTEKTIKIIAHQISQASRVSLDKVRKETADEYRREYERKLTLKEEVVTKRVAEEIEDYLSPMNNPPGTPEYYMISKADWEKLKSLEV